MDISLPDLIENAEEVFGVNTFEGVKPYVAHDKIVIFRKFSQCAPKFDDAIFPRWAKHVDAYVPFKYRNTTRGNAFTTGFYREETVELSLEFMVENKSNTHYGF